MDVMQQPDTAGVAIADAVPEEEAPQSAVSWAAIIAGAVVAAAASLILLVLGSGLGLAAAGGSSGASVAKFSVMTGVWLIIVQWIASGTGGYVTGRLRTKWADLHTHEVFFRDTAHGFVSWAVGTIIVAGVFASAATSLLGSSARAATLSGAAAAQGAAANPAAQYDVDTLFRSAGGSADQATLAARDEAVRILTRGISFGDVPDADRDYMAHLVAARAGISQTEARRRVDDTIGRMHEAADAARRTAATTSLVTALSMLVGAFIACVAAALGGRRRDAHP
jgi:hypothetical protein